MGPDIGEGNLFTVRPHAMGKHPILALPRCVGRSAAGVRRRTPHSVHRKVP